jgi:DNA-binding MarR family transcriptional regulator
VRGLPQEGVRRSQDWKGAAMSKAKEAFAPVPMRALGDDRLTGTHLRALAAIAYRDRLGRNGQGCWASPQDLATVATVNTKNLITAISELVSWGYVSRATRPDDKRKRVYRVIYNDQDHHQAAPKGSPQATDASEIGCPDGPDRLPTNGIPPFSAMTWTSEENLREDIAQSALERYSAEAGTRPKDVHRDVQQQVEVSSSKEGKFLRQLQGWLKAETRQGHTRTEVAAMRGWKERVDEIWETTPLDDPINGWARGLGDELHAILENYPEEDE